MFGNTNHWQLDGNKHTPNPTHPPAVQPTVVFGHRSPARGKSWARHVHPLPLYGNNGAALHPALVCSAFRFGTATRLLVHFRFRPLVNAPSPLFISNYERQCRRRVFSRTMVFEFTSLSDPPSSVIGKRLGLVSLPGYDRIDFRRLLRLL